MQSAAGITGRLLGARIGAVLLVAWLSSSSMVGDLVAALTLLSIAVPGQLATARLAGMPPITGLYAFVAGTVLFALLGSNPQMSVGADSTVAPLFAVGLAAMAATNSPHYVALVGILAAMVGVFVTLVGVLRFGWLAEFLSAPIISGFLAGVADHHGGTPAPGPARRARCRWQHPAPHRSPDRGAGDNQRVVAGHWDRRVRHRAHRTAD